MQASARIENRDEQLEGDRGVDRGAAFHDLREGHLALEGDDGAHLLLAHVPDRLVDFVVNLLAIEQGFPLLLAFPVENFEALPLHVVGKGGGADGGIRDEGIGKKDDHRGEGEEEQDIEAEKVSEDEEDLADDQRDADEIAAEEEKRQDVHRARD